ncbi:MAG: MGMT family protein [Flavobacteriales bacterium]|jgi:methylated-DNA-protein-cysteine methyltransferase related protein|uniref:Methylated-DNA-[protein]-cysteine S-methyltransferase DNA binding domain-containing protein n=1 Tax=marine metagenome TaxID=408172 RepID=A0A382DP03_9ZZZZ|nr:cysteine methyltransferase [Flavobacteriaceae bacterium]MBC8455504.1 MGMT family protein [Flavobacteriales bacterium]MDG2174445.1 MGMT family protein [Flavobacteriaceae bacterium]|tara:strand:- start:1088 stop:1420 length:333 start_codon:yes stop_codon:yes gene_type:complete
MNSINESFFDKVYTIVRKIPHGRVTTYGLIAKCLGTPKSARMVGYAMNSSHKFSDIPAHRVVNRNGLLTGKHHFFGSSLMQELLENEGVIVIDNKIKNFNDVLWDPSTRN